MRFFFFLKVFPQKFQLWKNCVGKKGKTRQEVKLHSLTFRCLKNHSIGGSMWFFFDLFTLKWHEGNSSDSSWNRFEDEKVKKKIFSLHRIDPSNVLAKFSISFLSRHFSHQYHRRSLSSGCGKVTEAIKVLIKSSNFKLENRWKFDFKFHSNQNHTHKK